MFEYQPVKWKELEGKNFQILNAEVEESEGVYTLTYLVDDKGVKYLIDIQLTPTYH